MSIRIEVTGDSLVEVSDKLLAIGNSLRNTASQSADDAAREALQAERNSKAAPAKKAPAAKASPEKAAEPVAEDKAPEPTPEVEKAAEPSAEAASVDYEKDVAPLVPKAVVNSGREAVIALLSEFGVERAGLVPDAQLAEFRDRLRALAG